MTDRSQPRSKLVGSHHSAALAKMFMHVCDELGYARAHACVCVYMCGRVRVYVCPQAQTYSREREKEREGE